MILTCVKNLVIFENVIKSFDIKSRSSRLKVSYENGILKNVANFRGKHLCQSPFFNKVASLRPATLFKKRLLHRRFLVKFTNFLRTTVLIEISVVADSASLKNHDYVIQWI